VKKPGAICLGFGTEQHRWPPAMVLSSLAPFLQISSAWHRKGNPFSWSSPQQVNRLEKSLGLERMFSDRLRLLYGILSPVGHYISETNDPFKGVMVSGGNPDFGRGAVRVFFSRLSASRLLFPKFLNASCLFPSSYTRSALTQSRACLTSPS